MTLDKTPKNAGEFVEVASDLGYYFALYSSEPDGFYVWRRGDFCMRHKPNYTELDKWAMHFADVFRPEILEAMQRRLELAGKLKAMGEEDIVF